jgi:diguanylate cyclase (GGDEF)-like protein
MQRLKKSSLQSENYRLLLENSLSAIPFNVLIGGGLSLDLYYQHMPKNLIFFWYMAIIIISLFRWIYSKNVLKNEYYKDNNQISLGGFLVLTLIMGCVWGSCYLLFLPYLTMVHEVVIILILGGMAAGSATSLSAYLPAYYAFILPMFLPPILYNFSFFQLERSILASMFLLFVIMVGLIAKINNRLLERIFQLNSQKDYLISQLSVFNKKLESSNEEIRVMSITDSLTGLFNRRYFDNSLLQQINKAKQNRYPIGLILIDIDNFKFINDTHGHPYGDSYLIYVATVLKKSIRRTNDILVRLGGDEFAAILTNMSVAEVSALCELIRSEFAKGNKHPNVTLSIGIICIEPGNCDELKNIISVADKLLYQAKEKGKNQTVSQVI